MVKLGAAVPVPFSTTVCGEPLALSVTVRLAVKLATDAGAKVRVMPQLAFGESEDEQVLVCAKLPELAPVMEILLILSAAMPVLVRVTDCMALVEPLVAVKFNGPAGVSDTAGVGGAVAVPLRVTICGEPVALSAIDSATL
jgi:hypothetical protein